MAHFFEETKKANFGSKLLQRRHLWAGQDRGVITENMYRKKWLNGGVLLRVHSSTRLQGGRMGDSLWSYACCVRRKSSEEAEQRERSQKIDKQIEKDKLHLRRQVKLLLLGAGESGKSTLLKQMKIIHGHNFDEAAVAEFRTTIYVNVIKGMKVLVDARDKLRIQWSVADNALLANRLLKLDSVNLDTKLFVDYVSIVRVLWMDESIRAAFSRRREFQLADSVRYFFDNLDRIGTPNYVPSNQDILHCRKATKGISEFKVDINSIPFLFVDVGGQRSQRQKWFQCFDSVTSILFLVSSSEFDQVILEDRCTNRLVEARNIFETIINNRCFSEVSVIVFLNKTDLLRQKVERTETDIRNYFNDFTGRPHELDDVQNYMVAMFDGVRRDRRRPLFHHLTTAVDTENIKVVFNAVRDTILQKNLKQLMLQ